MTLKPRSFAGNADHWLGRVGIGFVVLSVAFLLKLSFDRGWVTPAVRVGSGFGFGLMLLFAGLKLDASRRALGQVLLGGSIAILYLTEFAGSQLYELLPFGLALSLMSTTTVVAIALAERQDSSAMAVLGVAGGLSTPFLLEASIGGGGLVAIYSMLVLLGGGALYLHRGWVSLLGSVLLGGTVTVALMVVGHDGSGLLLPSLPLFVFWLTAGLTPILRPVIYPVDAESAGDEGLLWVSRIASVWSTAAFTAFLAWLWSTGVTEPACLLFAIGTLAVVGARHLRANPRPSLLLGELAALCLAVGFILQPGGHLAPVLLLAEAAVLLAVVARGGPGSLKHLSNFLAAIVAAWFLFAIASSHEIGFAGFREGAFPRLSVLVLSGVISKWLTETDAFEDGKDLMLGYGGLAYLGLLFWSTAELAPRPFGTQLVTIAWSLQGTIVLLLSFKWHAAWLKVLSLGTLALVAGKLLVFDLSALDPVWRILMFFGFGAVLLGLAHFVSRRDGGEGEADAPVE